MICSSASSGLLPACTLWDDRSMQPMLINYSSADAIYTSEYYPVLPKVKGDIGFAGVETHNYQNNGWTGSSSRPWHTYEGPKLANSHASYPDSFSSPHGTAYSRQNIPKSSNQEPYAEYKATDESFACQTAKNDPSEPSTKSLGDFVSSTQQSGNILNRQSAEQTRKMEGMIKHTENTTDTSDSMLYSKDVDAIDSAAQDVVLRDQELATQQIINDQRQDRGTSGPVEDSEDILSGHRNPNALKEHLLKMTTDHRSKIAYKCGRLTHQDKVVPIQASKICSSASSGLLPACTLWDDR